MKITLILASYDSGHYHGGMGQGPDALIAGGLVDALTMAGHDVAVEDIGRVGAEQEREIATGFAVCNAVSGEVRIAIDRGRFPIVLAGNCLTSAGAVAGEGADAIIWADQHGDLNTPETSTYGFLDGMALATVLGLCWRPMAGAIPGFKPIDPSRCVLVNARDLDPAEEQLLKTLPVIRTECTGVVQATQRLQAAGAKACTCTSISTCMTPRICRPTAMSRLAGRAPNSCATPPVPWHWRCRSSASPFPPTIRLSMPRLTCRRWLASCSTISSPR